MFSAEFVNCADDYCLFEQRCDINTSLFSWDIYSVGQKNWTVLCKFVTPVYVDIK